MMPVDIESELEIELIVRPFKPRLLPKGPRASQWHHRGSLSDTGTGRAAGRGESQPTSLLADGERRVGSACWY